MKLTEQRQAEGQAQKTLKEVQRTLRAAASPIEKV
jgi:hypothetical protein